MEFRLDMHVHSRRSPDGLMTLSEIAERAREAGLHGVAVCDHDRVFPEDEPLDAFPGLLIVPGVEASTDIGHLLGWFVTRPVKARTFPEAVAEIHAQGGIAVLAHPFEHTTRPERAETASKYVDGVEVWNSRAERKNRRANAMAAAFASTHNLRGFAGSDAHTPREIGNGVTIIRADALTPEAVKAALLYGEVRTEGQRSKAVWTAVSQRERLRKSNAGPLSYCKWGAFAVKCALEDLFRP